MFFRNSSLQSRARVLDFRTPKTPNEKTPYPLLGHRGHYRDRDNPDT